MRSNSRIDLAARLHQFRAMTVTEVAIETRDAAGPVPIRHDLLAGQGGHRIDHGFFTRKGGVSNGLYGDLNAGIGSDDTPENVNENKRRIAAALGGELPALVTVHQIHSPDVQVIDAPFERARPKADALVTTTPGLIMAVLTADCGPVLFADQKAGVVGAAHAGWRGAVAGVLENTVEAMERLGARRDGIAAVLGPTISQANYEVGPELRDAVLAAPGGDDARFTPSQRDGHWMFDLPGFILARLQHCGIQAAVTGHCTYGEEHRFFSYRRATHRREPDYGRQISAIRLGPVGT